jgi:hypothetical protein
MPITVGDPGLFQAYGAAAMHWYRTQYAAFAEPSEDHLRAAKTAWREVESTRDAWLTSIKDSC